MGKCRHIVAYPISHAKVINFVGFCTVPEKEGTVYEGKIMEERTRAELLEYFVGWDDEVQQLIQVRVRLVHNSSQILNPICSVSRNPVVGPSRQSDLCHCTHTIVLHYSVMQ